MIPKIIHYCWFGRGRKSPETLRFIQTWRTVLPDYEIIEWNEDNFPYKEWIFCREAYAVKSYAFVADVCRLYALHEMGGIYLDTDVEVLKSFDPYLHLDSFVGEEDENKIGTACIGAKKGTIWIKEFLDYYENRHFINRKGRLMSVANTDILKEMLAGRFDKPQVYPIDLFCGKLYTTSQLIVTENTVCIHHYTASWIKPLTIMNRLSNLITRIKLGLL